MNISILVDDPEAWIVPFARDILKKLADRYKVGLYFNAADLPRGDILFLLGCTSLVPLRVLARHKHNFVVHESSLPQGRGWSPLAWQVLEGKTAIPIALIEAVAEPDAGMIFLRDTIELDGGELLPDLRRKQGEKTAALVYRLMDKWPDIQGLPQSGKATRYRKRSVADDMLELDKSIRDNFNHLRIVDNDKYPAWFEYAGQKYIIKIYKAD